MILLFDLPKTRKTGIPRNAQAIDRLELRRQFVFNAAVGNFSDHLRIVPSSTIGTCNAAIRRLVTLIQRLGLKKTGIDDLDTDNELDAELNRTVAASISFVREPGQAGIFKIWSCYSHARTER